LHEIHFCQITRAIKTYTKWLILRKIFIYNFFLILAVLIYKKNNLIQIRYLQLNCIDKFILNNYNDWNFIMLKEQLLLFFLFKHFRAKKKTIYINKPMQFCSWCYWFIEIFSNSIDRFFRTKQTNDCFVSLITTD